MLINWSVVLLLLIMIVKLDGVSNALPISISYWSMIPLGSEGEVKLISNVVELILTTDKSLTGLDAGKWMVITVCMNYYSFNLQDLTLDLYYNINFTKVIVESTVEYPQITQ